MRIAPLVMSVFLSSSACYQFMPLNDSAPLPEAGAEVRFQLNSPQSLELGTMTLNDVASVQGHVRQSGADNTLSLFSSDLRTTYGYRQRTDGAVFSFNRSQFRTLEQRKLIPWKTGVAAGTALIGMAAFWYFAVELGSGGAEGGTLPPPSGASRVATIPFNWVLPRLIP